jgi:hypothetical protein
MTRYAIDTAKLTGFLMLAGLAMLLRFRALRKALPRG